MSAALERKIKRHVLGSPQSALIRFPRGFGDVCLAETEAALAALRLKSLMAPEVRLGVNAVEVKGAGFVDLLALTLRLTTAREILWLIHAGKAANPKSLREELASVDWDVFLPEGIELGVRVESTASRVFHEGKVRDEVSAVLSKRSIACTTANGAEHLLDVRLYKDRLALALSLGGRPLYQRRYKAELRGVATVKEDVAAAATLAALAFIHARRGADWRPGLVLAPFAGSGTLGFEATLALGQLPPCLFYGRLSAERFPCCPEASVRHARKKLAETVTGMPAVRFVEKDAGACRTLQANTGNFNDALNAMGIPNAPFRIVQGDAFDALAGLTPETPTFVAMNPPYGRRLKDPSSSHAAFAKAGKLIRRACAGTGGGYAMLPDPEAAQAFAAAFGAGDMEVRAFMHGGKTVQLVSFCPG